MAGYKNLAAKIHIHVLQVIQVGDLWTAIIQIALEPDFKKELAEKKKLEQLKHDRLHEKKEVKEKPEVKAKFAGDEPKGKGPKIEIPAHEPPVHIYIPSLLEPGDLYEPHHYIEHPNYNFHFLEPGSSFWEASLEITPDIDFYETVENVAHLASEIAPEEEPSPAPKLAKSRKPKALDLTLSEEV